MSTNINILTVIALAIGTHRPDGAVARYQDRRALWRQAARLLAVAVPHGGIIVDPDTDRTCASKRAVAARESAKRWSMTSELVTQVDGKPRGMPTHYRPFAARSVPRHRSSSETRLLRA
jgi:hypothetical protein